MSTNNTSKTKEWMDSLSEEDTKVQFDEGQFIDDLFIVIKELYLVVHKIGMWDQLSQKTRDFAHQNEEISQHISQGEGPRLEPRLSMEELRGFIIRSLNVPSSQYDFYDIIIKICYLMQMSELNPLIVQEIRGVNKIGTSLERFFKQ